MARGAGTDRRSRRLAATVVGVAGGAGLGTGLSLLADPATVTAGALGVALVAVLAVAVTRQGPGGGGHSGAGWDACAACAALSRGPEAFRQALAHGGRIPGSVAVIGLVRFSCARGLDRAMECELLTRVARTAAGRERDAGDGRRAGPVGLYRLPGDRLALLSNGPEPGLRSALRSLVDRANGELEGAVVAAGLDGGGGLAEVFAGADAAMRAAASAGGGLAGGADLGVPLTQERAGAVRRLVTGASAIGVAYQPVVELATGRVLGYEALMRPRGTNLDSPTAVFDLAGRIGLTARLDRACREAVLLDAPGLDMRQGELLFVNIAPQALVDPALDPAGLARAVHGAGLVPQRVVLEIADGAGVEPRHLARAAAIVREQGFRLAIDDVGGPASRLETLRLCRADYLKIDEVLTREAARDPQSLALFRSLCGLANQVGCTLVVEGVETEALLAFVHGVMGHTLEPLALGAAQGYHLGRPGPRPQLTPAAGPPAG